VHHWRQRNLEDIVVSLFEVIREQVDLVAVADRHLDLLRSGSSLKGRCPYQDHEDNTPSFYLYPDSRFFCYGCRRHGDVTDLWALVKGLRPGLEAALDLAQEYGVDLPKMSLEARERAEQRREAEAEYLRQAEEHHEALSLHPQVVEWWEGRGFDEGLRETFLLGVIDDGANAVIPYWSRGRAQGLIRRKLDKKPDDKYLLPKKEEFPLGHRPLFVPGAVKDGMFLVEGFVDALALSVLGYGVAAVGGPHPNQEQLEELKRFPGQIYVLPDANEEGREAARRWVEHLFPKTLLCPPNYEKETTK
jgi:DNA primase